MTLPFLLTVTSDPRTSTRPAEAIRVAAGITVWKKVEVSLYLRDTAIQILSSDTEDLKDGDNYGLYLPILRDLQSIIYVQAGSPQLAAIGEASLPFQEIEDTALARLTLQAKYVARF